MKDKFKIEFYETIYEIRMITPEDILFRVVGLSKECPAVIDYESNIIYLRDISDTVILGDDKIATFLSPNTYANFQLDIFVEYCLTDIPEVKEFWSSIPNISLTKIHTMEEDQIKEIYEKKTEETIKLLYRTKELLRFFNEYYSN